MVHFYLEKIISQFTPVYGLYPGRYCLGFLKNKLPLLIKVWGCPFEKISEIMKKVR